MIVLRHAKQRAHVLALLQIKVDLEEGNPRKVEHL
jgi:hypothetical protein